MGVDVGVVDSTGNPTLFVGNFTREMIGVFRHQRKGLFVNRAASSHIGRPSRLSLTFGLFLFDTELDGDLDLFVANGHVRTHPTAGFLGSVLAVHAAVLPLEGNGADPCRF